jgi:aspartate/methionine/tyrosine aminotransferase
VAFTGRFPDGICLSGKSLTPLPGQFTVINPGDEVVLFNPSYETYPANVAMAGGIARFVDLHPPHWSFQEGELLAGVGPRCKAIVVNR